MDQGKNIFHVLAEGKDEVMARQHRDKHCYVAGKEAANMKLSRVNEVQYEDDRDQRMFNMGWMSGEL